MLKEKAVLVGPNFGELGWSLALFVPHIRWLKSVKYKNQDIKFIICTRPDRFDLYGNIADIFEPLVINGDSDKFHSECWTLIGLPISEHSKYTKELYNIYSAQYDIIEHVYADYTRHTGLEYPFPISQMSFNLNPRQENSDLIDMSFKSDKKLVVLAPRYRKQKSVSIRNWPYWESLYNMIYNDISLKSKYEFIVCGKRSESYDTNKFFNVNDIKLTENTSLIGLTMEFIKRSVLTVGSQSAIPILSMMLKVPALQWGDDRLYMSEKFNFLNTPNIFIDDSHYFKLDPKIIFNEMKKILL